MCVGLKVYFFLLKVNITNHRKHPYSVFNRSYSHRKLLNIISMDTSDCAHFCGMEERI